MAFPQRFPQVWKTPRRSSGRIESGHFSRGKVTLTGSRAHGSGISLTPRKSRSLIPGPLIPSIIVSSTEEKNGQIQEGQANVSTQHQPPRQAPWLSCAHGNQGRSAGVEAPPRQG